MTRRPLTGLSRKETLCTTGTSLGEVTAAGQIFTASHQRYTTNENGSVNSELCEPILDLYRLVFYIFLTCGSAVIVAIVIFHQDCFMTQTLNFRVVSLFLKGGDVEAAKTMHCYPVLAGNQLQQLCLCVLTRARCLTRTPVSCTSYVDIKPDNTKL